MTEEEINKIACIVADKVINSLEAAQKEWDKKYEKDLEAYGFEIQQPEDPLTMLNMQLENQKVLLKTALLEEDYSACKEIDLEIFRLNKEILKLMRQ